MKTKIAAFVLLIVAMLGLGVSPALAATSDQTCTTYVADDNTIEKQICKPAPKKSVSARWVYCDPIVDYKVTFFDNQGYCGDSVKMNRPEAGQCRYMGVWDNWAGSMFNYYVGTTVLWQGTCGSSLFLTTQYGSEEPDLYIHNLGNAVTNLSR